MDMFHHRIGVGMLTIDEKAALAMKMLMDKGYEAYIIGGCVRDYLMGREPGDIDITTSAEPEEIKKIFKDFKTIETGIKHGTITVLIDTIPIEITTYRIDCGYSDGRHPDRVCFTKSLREDAARRDFTMNAIACSHNGDIVDYFKGAVDISDKTIRAVGEPEVRFREDALRILRAIRFSSVLGFQIEEKTKDAIFQCRELLKNISAERICAELLKLLCGEKAGDTVKEYADVLGVFIPELIPMKGFQQHNLYHKLDLLSHTCKVIDSIEPKPLLRLCALLHDIGKPKAFTTDSQGTGHFYKHSVYSADMSKDILRRLKLDRKTTERAVMLVEYHDMKIDASPEAVKKALGRLSPEVFFQLVELQRADSIAQDPADSDKRGDYDRLGSMARGIIERGECFSKESLAVSGDDLLRLGIKSGKRIGSLLDELLQLVIEGKLENSRPILEGYIKEKQGGI